MGKNQVLFLSQMEESKMAKQVHIRVDDDIYKELSDYSVVSGQSMQDCLSVAIRQMLVKAKEEPSQDCNGYTFIDLFAGIGGMRLAFESAGGRCVYSNEWNKYSQQTYYANFGVQPDGDITKVQAESILDHDILVAGFPCQPFSIAGVSKKNSLGRATGFEDKTQGTLFFDVCRILKAKRPKAFMLTIGNLAMRQARAQFSCNFLACAGYEVVDNLGFPTVEAGIEAAMAAKADIVVLCSSDDEYAEYAVPAFKALDGRAIFIVAGAPANMEELKAVGIENFIHVRVNVLETLKEFNAKLLK